MFQFSHQRRLPYLFVFVAAVLIEERREWLRQQKSECPFDEMLAVSNYIKELLLFVVGVHAELFLHARHFSQQVLAYCPSNHITLHRRLGCR